MGRAQQRPSDNMRDATCEVDALGFDNQKILVVEPDDDLRLTMTRVLQRNGFEVEGAAVVQEAAAASDRCRLIVASHEPPDASAMNLIQWAAQQDPAIPVILTSAGATVAAAVAAMRQGACDYLIKPFEPERLEAVVRNALDAFPSQQSTARAPEHRSSH